MISKRHTRSNNPGVPGYNPNEQHNHIKFYDANNIYGWAMSSHFHILVLSGLIKPPDEPGKGCILEEDVEYPADFHDLHNDYPLVPEPLNVKQVVV